MSLLKKLSQYFNWADDTIWRIVQGITDGEFNKVLGENSRSLKDRFVHLAQDHWEWYFDWTGEEPGDEPDFKSMSREELFDFYTEFKKKWFDLIDNRTVNNLEINRAGKVINISFEEILFHMVNHGTYHRGQIVMGLRLLNKDVQMTDYVPFRIATAI